MAHSPSKKFLRTISETLSSKMERRLRTAQQYHASSIEGTEQLEQSLIDKIGTARMGLKAVHDMPPVLN